MKVKGLNWAGRSFILPLVIVLLLLASVVKNGVADTSVSGTISSDTTWTKATSPYIVTGSVVVSSGVKLTIEPGVTVKLDSGKALQIDGTLIAKGTNSEKITFTRNSGDNWGYILFSNSSTDASYDSSGNYSSGSILEYCVVEYAGGVSVSNNGAIRLNSAHPFINYCTIQNNSASGINAYNISGTLKITKSTIMDNESPSSSLSSSFGGGVSLSHSSGGTTKISDNMIKNNTSSYRGGGIFTEGGTVTITNNTISGNKGGIFVNNGTVTITNNTISGNTASSSGGGIYASGTVTITSNVISGNTSSSYGGGIYAGATVTITSNIISGNTSSSSYGGGIYGGGVISKNSLTGNTAENNAAVYYPSGDNKDFKYNVITGNKADDTTVYINSNPLFNYNNIFSNTASYDLWYGKSQNSSNLNAENNWWGSSDDATVQGKIYDFIDDSAKALVDYLPYDTAIRTDCPISPPTGLTATAGTNYINLSWTANSESDTKGYKVYWDTDSGHSYANSVDVGNVTSYTITSLTGSKYYVTVTAYDTSYSSASDDTSTIVNENMTNGNESWYAEEKAVTLTSSDTTPPTISSTSPSNGATGVAIDTSITVTFSEAMDSTTISTSTFTMSGGMTGTVSYDSTTKTATFTPSSKLSYATTYTATITTGVKDSAGNAMSSNYTWSFTTTSGPDTTVPTGSISINSGAAYAKSTSVTLVLSATDGVGVIGYYLSESSSIPLASASGWSTVSSTTSYSGSVTYTLSSGDGNKTVYVWYKDAAPNVSSSAIDTITLDTTAPTITITSPTSSSTYTTKSSTISPAGSASDSTSGVSSVTWSSDKGSSGTASGTTSWSISNISLSSGDNAITVTATDGAGNTNTDTITVTYNPGTTGALSLSKDTAYLSGDTIVATVVDADRNTSASVANTLTTALKLTGKNYSVGTDLNLSLVETGIDSGTFVATFKTGATTNTGVTPQIVKAIQSGILNVIYTDTAPLASSVTKTLSLSSFDATMAFDADSYSLDTYAVVTLADAERNTNYTTAESLLSDVYIQTSSVNSTKVRMVETGADTGTFKGSIQIASSGGTTEFVRIQATEGDSLKITYDDNVNTTGYSRTVIGTATVKSESGDGLVAYYPFNGNANDESGNGNNGTVNGASLTTDRNGNASSAYSFDGVNDYIEVADSNSLDIVSAITITSWVYLRAFNTNMQVVQKDSTSIHPHAYALPILSDGGCYYYGCGYPNRFGLELMLDGNFISEKWSNTSLEKNKWYFLTVTYNSSNINVYLNGVLDKTYSSSGSIQTNNNPLHIGNFRKENKDFLDGVIDELRIYNRALTESEILELYNEAGVIAGTVVDASSNAPISGAVVSTDVGYAATTDATGSYTIQNVTPGNYLLAASATSYDSSYTSIIVSAGVVTTANFSLLSSVQPTPTPTLSPCEATSIGVSPASLALAANESSTVTVTVRGDDNCPVVEGETVTATVDASSENYIVVSPAIATTDANGQAVFIITALNNSGNATVVFQAGSLAKTLTVYAQGVYGTVNDSFEDTLEGVTVTIVGEGISDSTETDEDGYYEFQGLAVGDYTLTYGIEGYVTQTQEISLEEGETKELDTITMPLMSTIYGYVFNVKGEPINRARLKLKGIYTKYVETKYSDADGYFEFTGLEADTYLIFARKRGYLPKKIRVKLEEGEEKDVDEITLRRKS